MPTAIPLFSAILLASALGAHAQAINLRGRVIEKANLQPVPGALVKLAGFNQTATTGTDGRFVLTGSSALGGTGVRHPSSPYLRNGAVYVEALAPSQIFHLELFTVTGESVHARQTIVSKAGWNRLPAVAWPDGDFLGFLSITSAGETHVQRVFHLAGPAPTDWSSQPGENRPALAKKAKGAKGPPGQVEVSKDLLLKKTVVFAADDTDLGDIELDYPARAKIGVGAVTPYGAATLFDGSKGKAAALQELQAKWQDWIPAVTGETLKKYTKALNQFKIAKDPEFPSDTNRVTLQSCCDTLWGYDDMQAKAVHGDVQIHVEFILMGKYDDTENSNAGESFATKDGPAYNNSGVYVQSRYEVQIKSWTTNASSIPGNHDMGSLVDDHPPSKNASKANGVWQAYDITFRAARYNLARTRTEHGRMSVWWNGVLVHDNREATAKATGLANHSGEEMNPTPYGLKLQSEGTDVRYRNVWMKELTLKDPKTDVGY